MADHGWTWRTEKQIPSERGAGRRLIEEVLGKLKQHEWFDHDIFGVHLALEEALANAIRHGNGLDASKQVRILCNVSRYCVRIEVEDEGQGFDPADVPDPTDDVRLEVASGRGIMLMRSFMSRVEYNESGNRVVLEKEIQRQSATS